MMQEKLFPGAQEPSPVGGPPAPSVEGESLVTPEARTAMTDVSENSAAYANMLSGLKQAEAEGPVTQQSLASKMLNLSDDHKERAIEVLKKAQEGQPLDLSQAIGMMFATLLPTLAGAAMGGTDGALMGATAGMGAQAKELEQTRKDRVQLGELEAKNILEEGKFERDFSADMAKMGLKGESDISKLAKTMGQSALRDQNKPVVEDWNRHSEGLSMAKEWLADVKILSDGIRQAREEGRTPEGAGSLKSLITGKFKGKFLPTSAEAALNRLMKSKRLKVMNELIKGNPNLSEGNLVGEGLGDTFWTDVLDYQFLGEENVKLFAKSLQGTYERALRSGAQISGMEESMDEAAMLFENPYYQIEHNLGASDKLSERARKLGYQKPEVVQGRYTKFK